MGSSLTVIGTGLDCYTIKYGILCFFYFVETTAGHFARLSPSLSLLFALSDSDRGLWRWISMNWSFCGSPLLLLLHTQAHLYFRAANMNKHVCRHYLFYHTWVMYMWGNELLGGALHSLSESFFQFYFVSSCRGAKLLLLWVSIGTEEGSMGSESSFSGLWAIVLQSGREWAAEVSGVLGCRRLDQRQSRCVSSPPPLLSPGQGLCVYSWPQRTSVLHSSQQLSSSTFPSSQCLSAAKAKKTQLRSGRV